MSLLLGPLGGKRSFNPRQELFSNNEQGLWLDPSDMTAGKAAWRRNLLLNTEALSLSPWTADGATFSANTTVAPNGTTTAGTFTGASGNYRIYQQRTSVVGASHTISLYVKQGTSPTVQIDYINVNNGPVFTFATESFSSIGGFTTNVQNVGNGWYRLSVTATNINSNPGPGFRASGVTTFFIWGVQYEQSSTPTDYQPITDFSTEFKAAYPTHALYQDSNGVTPCTAAGDPVGLILDQSRGGLGVQGAELVTNGDFASGQTGWIDSPVAPSGWSFTGGALVGSNAAGGYEQAIQVTSGKWYRCTITLSNFSGGAVSFAIAGAGAGPTFNSNGTNTVLINAGSTGNIGIVRRTSNFTGTIDNISVREVPGNHAYQTTSASRPTLARIPSSGRRNLLTYSEQFDNAAWTKVNATPSANATTAPDGTSTADALIDDATNADHKMRQGVAITSGTTYTVSVYAKANTLNFVWIYAGTPNVGRVFNLATGATGGTVGNAPTSSAISAIGNGWYRCSITYTAGATSTQNHDIGTSPDGTSINYIGTGQSAFLWGAQLETGSTATNYQKVAATTDVTESGVSDLWHLVFDGSDDSLVTNAVDFTATDEMTVIAGVRKLSDAIRGTVVELSASWQANNGTFGIEAPDGNSSASYRFVSKGTSSDSQSPTPFTSPLTRVLTLAADISSPSLIARVNSSVVATSTASQGTGNFGNHVVWIGRRNGTEIPFNGHIYQLIVRGRTTPTGKLLEAERFVAAKTGVTGI